MINRFWVTTLMYLGDKLSTCGEGQLECSWDGHNWQSARKMTDVFCQFVAAEPVLSKCGSLWMFQKHLLRIAEKPFLVFERI